MAKYTYLPTYLPTYLLKHYKVPKYYDQDCSYYEGKVQVQLQIEKKFCRAKFFHKNIR